MTHRLGDAKEKDKECYQYIQERNTYIVWGLVTEAKDKEGNSNYGEGAQK